MKRGKIAVFALAGVVALGGSALIALSRLPSQPPTATYAVVTGIYPTGARFPAQVVTFRSTDGLTGQASMPTDEVACRPGDTVHAVRSGVALNLSPGSCRQSPPPPWSEKVR